MVDSKLDHCYSSDWTDSYGSSVCTLWEIQNVGVLTDDVAVQDILRHSCHHSGHALGLQPPVVF